MTGTDMETAPGALAAKPRLVLMGEFSSGKSTLSNILLGGTPLPMQVTATRLPPVYVSHGPPAAYAQSREGDLREVDLTDLSGLTPETTRSVHLTMLSDTLELCDLVDMPGISDPNMPSDTWDQVVGPADHVIWCTHATQAWRQSEAALWDRLQGATSGKNILLVTQFDKLRSPRDRDRVLGRVRKEAGPHFTAIYPVSLLDALQAGDDFDAWNASGAHAFLEHLIELVLAGPAAAPSASRAAGPVAGFAEPQMAVLTRPDFSRSDLSQPEPAAMPDDLAGPDQRIMPRRVQGKSGAGNRPRLPRETAADVAGQPFAPGAV